MSDQLTHLDEQGAARMVDVGGKPNSERVAIAEGYVVMNSNTLRLIREGAMKKGDVLMIAKIAGMMGAKRTAELIPLCHPIALTKIDVELELVEEPSAVRIVATAQTIGKTGVEMEALMAVNIAALTIYDMAKAVDRGMQVTQVRLLKKQGGQHGDYEAGVV